MPGPISLFKYFIFFSISFVILSCPIGGETLFQSLYSKTRDITGPVYLNISSAGHRVWRRVSRYSSQVFSNAKPKINFVDLQSSSWKKDKEQVDSDQEFAPEEVEKIKRQLREEEAETSSSRDY